MIDERLSAIYVQGKTTDELLTEYLARRQSHLRAVAASQATPHTVSPACLSPVTNPPPQTALWAQQRVECMQLQRLHQQQQQQARLQQQGGELPQQVPNPSHTCQHPQQQHPQQQHAHWTGTERDSFAARSLPTDSGARVAPRSGAGPAAAGSAPRYTGSLSFTRKQALNFGLEGGTFVRIMVIVNEVLHPQVYQKKLKARGFGRGQLSMNSIPCPALEQAPGAELYLHGWQVSTQRTEQGPQKCYTCELKCSPLLCPLRAAAGRATASGSQRMGVSVESGVDGAPKGLTRLLSRPESRDRCTHPLTGRPTAHRSTRPGESGPGSFHLRGGASMLLQPLLPSLPTATATPTPSAAAPPPATPLAPPLRAITRRRQPQHPHPLLQHARLPRQGAALPGVAVPEHLLAAEAPGGGGREPGRGRRGAGGEGRAAVLRSLTGRGRRPAEGGGHPEASRLWAGPSAAGRVGVSAPPEAGNRFSSGQAAGRDPSQAGEVTASGTAQVVATTTTTTTTTAAAAAAAAGWRPASAQHGRAAGQDASRRNALAHTGTASDLSGLAARRAAAGGQGPGAGQDTGGRAAPTFTDTAALPPTAEAGWSEEGVAGAACEQDAGPRFVYGGGRTAATASPSEGGCLPPDPSHPPAAPSSHTPAHTATAPAVAAPAPTPAAVSSLTAAVAAAAVRQRASCVKWGAPGPGTPDRGTNHATCSDPSSCRRHASQDPFPHTVLPSRRSATAPVPVSTQPSVSATPGISVGAKRPSPDCPGREERRLRASYFDVFPRAPGARTAALDRGSRVIPPANVASATPRASAAASPLELPQRLPRASAAASPVQLREASHGSVAAARKPPLVQPLGSAPRVASNTPAALPEVATPSTCLRKPALSHRSAFRTPPLTAVCSAQQLSPSTKLEGSCPMKSDLQQQQEQQPQQQQQPRQQMPQQQHPNQDEQQQRQTDSDLAVSEQDPSEVCHPASANLLQQAAATNTHPLLSPTVKEYCSSTPPSLRMWSSHHPVHLQ
ncbi:MAG: hypothetical protein WDW38_004889 [Sanguina aurantia]